MLNRGEIARLRQAQELTQRQLADLTDLTVNTISTIETGTNSNPSLNTLSKIAEALQVPLQALFLSDESNDVVESSSPASPATRSAEAIPAPTSDKVFGSDAGATSK